MPGFVKSRVASRLGEIRKSRGVGASDLARRVQVSRQTIYAIEAGTYVPNTEVALNLARELEVTVDELFSLEDASAKSPESISAEVLSANAAVKGQPVRICQIGSKWVSVPVSATPYYMAEADGVINRAGRSNGRADVVVCLPFCVSSLTSATRKRRPGSSELSKDDLPTPL